MYNTTETDKNLLKFIFITSNAATPDEKRGEEHTAIHYEEKKKYRMYFDQYIKLKHHILFRPFLFATSTNGPMNGKLLSTMPFTCRVPFFVILIWVKVRNKWFVPCALGGVRWWFERHCHYKISSDWTTSSCWYFDSYFLELNRKMELNENKKIFSYLYTFPIGVTALVQARNAGSQLFGMLVRFTPYTPIQ